MVNRISWSAVAALVFICASLGCAAVEEDVFAQVFALGAIAWAILSLKEQT